METVAGTDVLKDLGDVIEAFFSQYDEQTEFVMIVKRTRGENVQLGAISNMEDKKEIPFILCRILAQMLESDFERNGIHVNGNDTTH